MLSYFQDIYIAQRYGIGLILTNWIAVWGAMFLLTKIPKQQTVKYWLKWIGKGLLFTACYLLIDSVLYAVIKDWNIEHMWNTERMGMLLVLILYSCLGSGFSLQTCLIRGSVYYTSYVLMVPVSEPIGQVLREINSEWYSWGQLMTPLVILVMTVAVVWFLRHYAYDRRRFAYHQVVMQLLMVATLSAVVEFVWVGMSPVPDSLATSEKLFNVVVCCILWLINLFSYYSFYQLARATYENENLLSIKHKNELELERFQVTSANYDDMQMIRHEIKNHDFYLKGLLKAGRYDQAIEYLERNSTADSALLKKYECGNYTVDVILNHAMTVARKSNVEIVPEVLIPKELPWPEGDICSLLSNLLDNAIEAASKSGQEHPQVTFRMWPRQEYLFIRVTNPVNDSIPEELSLSLKTTKEDQSTHGFGTRVMKRIVEQNNGSIRFSMENHRFITDVMLEIKMEAAK